MHTSTKECPSCHVQIDATASVCPMCGYAFSAAPPPPPSSTGVGPRIPITSSSYGTHNKIAAGLLAIFLGWLGIHAFYLNNTQMGLVLLLVSVVGGALTCGGVSGVVATLALVQGILYLVASDEEFHQKYVVEKRWF
ncbi:MAG: hypothetical protein HONBIEJF_00991 [Fimbriimonadaceae bacterium]|nr:hypothetical protein [Fimbriimonadaceae bacterium]